MSPVSTSQNSTSSSMQSMSHQNTSVVDDDYVNVDPFLALAPDLENFDWSTVLNSNVRGPSEACLFVANLPKEMENDELSRHLYRLFRDYGNILSVKSSRDHRGRPYGFIQFETVPQAIRAAQQGPQMNLEGRRLRIERARCVRTLYVRHIPGHVTDHELQAVCEHYGELESLYIFPASTYYAQQDAGGAHAVVQARALAQAAAALNQMSGHEVDQSLQESNTSQPSHSMEQQALAQHFAYESLITPAKALSVTYLHRADAVSAFKDLRQSHSDYLVTWIANEFASEPFHFRGSANGEASHSHDHSTQSYRGNRGSYRGGQQYGRGGFTSSTLRGRMVPFGSTFYGNSMRSSSWTLPNAVRPPHAAQPSYFASSPFFTGPSQANEWHAPHPALSYTPYAMMTPLMTPAVYTPSTVSVNLSPLSNISTVCVSSEMTESKKQQESMSPVRSVGAAAITSQLSALSIDTAWHPSVEIDDCEIFIGRLNAERVTHGQLLDRFMQYGTIVRVYLVNRRDTLNETATNMTPAAASAAHVPLDAFAFVRYEVAESASKAIEAENGNVWLGQSIKVSHAVPSMSPKGLSMPVAQEEWSPCTPRQCSTIAVSGYATPPPSEERPQ